MGILEAVVLWYWFSGIGVTMLAMLLDIQEGLQIGLDEWPFLLCAFAFVPLCWPLLAAYMVWGP